MDNLENNPLFNKNIVQNNPSNKILEKSDQYYFEVLTQNEKLSYNLFLSLIEEPSKIEKIEIELKPCISKEKTLNNNPEEIRRILNRVSYREKFSLNDFKNLSNYYRNKKNLSLKYIFDDMNKSIKEKRARIILNKFHMVFNYLLNENTKNNDMFNSNNSIILCLDNERENKILENYYENDYKKLFSSNNLKPNNLQSKSIINNKNKNNNLENNENKAKKKLNGQNSKITIGKQIKKSIKKSIKLKETKNDELENTKNNKKSKSKSKKSVSNNLENTNKEGDKKTQTISPSRIENDILTKKFLYGEYNFTNFIEEKEEDKKVENDISDEDSWGESIFFDDKEKEKNKESVNLKKEKDINLLGIKKNRNKSPEKEKKEIKEKKELNNNKKNYINFNDKGNNNKIEEKNIFEENNNEKINNNNNSNNYEINELAKNIEEPQIITLTEDDDEDDENTNNNNITQNEINNNSSSNISSSNISNSNISINNKSEYSYYNKNWDNNFQPSNKKLSMSPLANMPMPNPQYLNFNNEKIDNYLSKPSDIINSVEIIKLIKEKIDPYNNLIFKLVYTSKKQKDNYDNFKNAVIDKYSNLILIKTEKNKKFAIYFNEKLFSSKNKQEQETVDLLSFVFSFEKKIFFIPKERIICFTQNPSMPYLFKLSDHSIYIKNDFLSEKHYLMEKSKVFGINNLFQELNGGEKEFNISVLEVFRSEISEQ